MYRCRMFSPIHFDAVAGREVTGCHVSNKGLMSWSTALNTGKPARAVLHAWTGLTSLKQLIRTNVFHSRGKLR